MYSANLVEMYRISGSSLLNIYLFLISGSSSGCKPPDNEPDNLLIYYYKLQSLCWQIVVCNVKKQKISVKKAK